MSQASTPICRSVQGPKGCEQSQVGIPPQAAVKSLHLSCVSCQRFKGLHYIPGNYTPPPLPFLIDGHVEYEVECITNTRKEGKDREYLVHLAGFNESTWENVKNLTNWPEKLSECWTAKGMPCPPPVPYRVTKLKTSRWLPGLFETNKLCPREAMSGVSQL